VAPSPAPVRRMQVLVLVSIAQFMLLIDDTIVNVALPSIGKDLGMAEANLSWVVNAYFLTFGGFLLLGGRAADLLGRRRMLIVALVAFVGASLVAGLSGSGELLVTARAVQGLAGAFLSPAALSILLSTFRGESERAKALGVWAALTGMGAVTGLLAGGVLVETLDWRWVFFVNVPIGLAAVAVVPRIVPPDSRPDRRASPDWTGAILGTSGLLLLVYTVVETDRHSWDSPRTVGGLAMVGVLAALFGLRERSARQPLVPPALIGNRRVAIANCVTAVGAVGLFAMFFFLTLYMQNVQHWQPLRAGLSYLPFSLTIGVTSALVTRLIGRLSPRPLVVAGLLSAATGLWLLRGLEQGDSYAGELMPILVLTAFGLGLVLVPILEAATGSAGEQDSGLASALVTTSQQVGSAVGIAVLVTIATHRTNDRLATGAAPEYALVAGFQAAFTVAALILVAAAVLAALIGRVPRVEPTQHDKLAASAAAIDGPEFDSRAHTALRDVPSASSAPPQGRQTARPRT
jgi:EmrB/QacA subfamily drug resistance transporter